MAFAIDALMERLGLEALGLAPLDPAQVARAVTHESFIRESLGLAGNSSKNLNAEGFAVVAEAFEPETLGADNRLLALTGRPLFEAVVIMLLHRQSPEMSVPRREQYRDGMMDVGELAELARSLELGRHLRLGRAELALGGRDHDGNLSQAFLALVAVLFESVGWEGLLAIADRLLLPVWQDLPLWLPSKNPKGELLTLLLQRGMTTPTFREIGVWGPDHARLYKMGLYVDQTLMEQGEGLNKKAAEQVAAQKALRKLRVALAQQDRSPESPEALASALQKGTHQAAAEAQQKLEALMGIREKSSSKPLPGISGARLAQSRGAGEGGAAHAVASSPTQAGAASVSPASAHHFPLPPRAPDPTAHLNERRVSPREHIARARNQDLNSLFESMIESVGPGSTVDRSEAAAEKTSGAWTEPGADTDELLEPGFGDSRFDAVADRVYAREPGPARGVTTAAHPVPEAAHSKRDPLGLRERSQDGDDDALPAPESASESAEASKGSSDPVDYFTERFARARRPPLDEAGPRRPVSRGRGNREVEAGPLASPPDVLASEQSAPSLDDEDSRFNQEHYHRQRLFDTLFESSHGGRERDSGLGGEGEGMVARNPSSARASKRDMAGGGRAGRSGAGNAEPFGRGLGGGDHMGGGDPFDASLDRLLERASSEDERRWRKMLTTNPKGALLELSTKYELPVPEFRQISVQGPSHAPIFTVGLFVDGSLKVSAEGRTRKVAEQDAARVWLTELLENPPPVSSVRRDADSEG